MNNTSEFIFDDVLDIGFTVVPNGILNDERLTDGAIGLYCRIIKSKNIKGWKVYQSNLINQNNGKTKIMSAMKQLIAAGWIEKLQIRNERGHIAGINYKVFSKSIKPVIESITPKSENPISDKPTSVKPTSENEPLINKEDINKEIINKDYNKSSSSSEVEEEGNLLEINTKQILDLCQKLNCKLKKANVENLINVFGFDKVYKAIATVTSTKAFENKEIKNIAGYLTKVLNDMDKQEIKNVSVNIASKNNAAKSKFNNYKQRDYDGNLENELFGVENWD